MRVEKRRRAARRVAERGMTLVEIMVVVVIISMVTALVGSAVFDALLRAQRNTTHTQMMQIGEGLEQYRLYFRHYPSTSAGLQALATPPKSALPVMKKIPLDAWDQPYVYQYPGTHNAGDYDLFSMGQDELGGTEDDINNWSEFVE